MKNKISVIIDTDPGIDDALAILLMLNSPEIEVKAITTIAGNKDIQKVTDNAYTIRNQVKSAVPIYSGSQQPLINMLQVGQVMGESGLGNAVSIKNSKLDGQAVKEIINIVNSNPNEVSILAIGPLTNIALAIKSDQNFAKNLKQLIIMGGAFECYGNMNRVAEFNFFTDPDAAQIVLNAGCPKVIIPLDRCYETPIYLEEMECLKGSTNYDFIMSMIKPYIKNLANFEGQPGAIVYDALAAYYLLEPKLFSTKPINIQIETKGKFTKGMSVTEKRPYSNTKPNAEVVIGIDVKKFKEGFLKRVKI